MSARDSSLVGTADHRELPDGWGWYLYGITRSGWNPPAGGLTAPEVDEPVRALQTESLAAVVRPVQLSDLEESVLRAGSDDPAALAAIAQTHNEIIAAVHRDQAILPAKFGAIYSRADALLDALTSRQATLLDQLDRLDRCDEWAIHFYARPDLIERVAEEDAGIRGLREDIAVSSPGRGYLLERKLADAIAAARQRALEEIGRECYDRLAAASVDGQVRPPSGRGAGSANQVEVLRAAFLVARKETEAFLEEMASVAAEREGIRVAYTGPWPPYSFAGLAEEELR